MPVEALGGPEVVLAMAVAALTEPRYCAQAKTANFDERRHSLCVDGSSVGPVRVWCSPI